MRNRLKSQCAAQLLPTAPYQSMFTIVRTIFNLHCCVQVCLCRFFLLFSPEHRGKAAPSTRSQNIFVELWGFDGILLHFGKPEVHPSNHRAEQFILSATGTVSIPLAALCIGLVVMHNGQIIYKSTFSCLQNMTTELVNFILASCGFDVMGCSNEAVKCGAGSSSSMQQQ